MHLAYRWFKPAGIRAGDSRPLHFFQESAWPIPRCGCLLEVFEEIVRRCLEAGLVEGKRLDRGWTMVIANASPQHGAKPEQLGQIAKVSRTVREYLADLARENPVSENEENQPHNRWRHATSPRQIRCLLGEQIWDTERSFLFESLSD